MNSTLEICSNSAQSALNAQEAGVTPRCVRSPDLATPAIMKGGNRLESPDFLLEFG